MMTKMYKSGVATKGLELKLKYMIKNPPNANVLNQVAWLRDIVFDSNGRFSGFVMLKVV